MRVQAPEEAQSSVTVLSGEEVRRAGAFGVADALRGVAGIDVMRITATQWEISARGFNELMSNRMLVMVDGRSVYQDFQGLTAWEVVPIALEDIERIEIVRGPGSALYGANAFNGVINIVTKPVESCIGTRLSTRVGNHNFLENALIHADTMGCWKYKLTGGWRRRRALEGEASYETKGATGLLERPLGRDASMSISGGTLDGELEYWIDRLNVKEIDGRIGYGKIDFENGGLSLRMFTNVTYFTEKDTVFHMDEDYRIATYDAEIQYSRILGFGQRLVLGGSVRRNEVDCELLGPARVQYLRAGYIQHEWRPTPRLEILLGGRADDHELAGEQFTPRASIVVNPWKGHYFRMSTGTAFLNPTFLESYLDYSTSSAPGFDLSVRGNEHLDPETVTSYEVGYGFVSPKMSARVEVFRNVLSDIIARKVTETLPSPPAPVPGLPTTIEYRNDIDAEAYGGEIALSLIPASDFRVSGSYSYQRLEDRSMNRELRTSPRHKLSVGVDAKLPYKTTGTIWTHFIGGTEWEDVTIDERVLVNGYLRHALWPDKIALEAMVFNATGERMREYPDAGRLARQVAIGVSLAYSR
jgi:iron complex outermembrane receptor protein